MGRNAYGGQHLRLLRAVALACQDSSTETLMPEAVLVGLRDLLGFDSAAFHGVDSGAQLLYDYQDLDPDEPDHASLSPEEGVEMFWGHQRSTSCVHPHVRDDVASILATADGQSLRAWRECVLYRELFKPLGEEYSLILRLPDGPGRTFRLVCWRGSGRDFGEREKGDLMLLMPHLEGAYRRARRRRVVSALTSRQRELLELVAQGCTNYQVARRLDVSEGTVRTHLNHIYARLGVTSRTAAVTQSRIAAVPWQSPPP